jgi:hypothetical protein
MSWINDFELPHNVSFNEIPGNDANAELPFSEVEQNYIRQIDELHSQSWAEIDSTERLGALQELETRLAELEGRPSLEIHAERLGPGENGYFDRNRGIIVLSESDLLAHSPLEAIDTIAHEGRHAYQYYATLHPEIHNNPEEVAAWKQNFENYLPATLFGYELYRNQPVEQDAWAYGDMVRQLFAGQTT